MDKPVYIDFETKICASALNAISATVWDALGEATNPQEARQFIGAIGEAPTDGSSYARQNAQWVQIQVGNLHNDLTGRSAPDAHPVSAITGLQASLDQINLDIAGKAPASAGTASGTSFSPTGTVAATNVQSAIAEVSGDVTSLQGVVAGLGTPAASAVTFSPTGTVAATNVQAAIAEVASEKVALSGGTMTGPLTTTALTSNGQIESKATGFKFPDGTVQASAALTAFIGGNQSLAGNGYQKLPGGLILQWGQMSNDNSQGSGLSSISFPIAFPTAVLHVSVEAYSASVASGSGMNSARIPFAGLTNAYAIISWYGPNNALTTEQLAGMWFATGF